MKKKVHKILREEAVGLKKFLLYFKITIFVNMWNLGNFMKIWYFVNKCSIKVWI